MLQTENQSSEKCEPQEAAASEHQNDEGNTSNTLKRVKKRLASFTIRRKVKVDDKSEMSQCVDSDEPAEPRPKSTIRKIFRKSSFRKFINNIQNFTNFTVSSAVRENEIFFFGAESNARRGRVRIV